MEIFCVELWWRNRWSLLLLLWLSLRSLWLCVDCETTVGPLVCLFVSVLVFVNFAAFLNVILQVFRLRYLSHPHIHLPPPLLLILRCEFVALHLISFGLHPAQPHPPDVRFGLFNSPIFSEPSDLHHHSNPRYKNVERKHWINKGEKVLFFIMLAFFSFSVFSLVVFFHFWPFLCWFALISLI